MPNLASGTPFVGVLGILAILMLAFLLSNGKTRLNFRIILCAFALQAAIGAFVLYVPVGREAISTLSAGVNRLLDFSNAGINMVFGALAGDYDGAPPHGFSF